MTKVIQNTKFTVELTEQTVKELLLAIEKAKKDSGLSIANINVESKYSSVKFNISLETKPHTQESLGYRLGYIESIGYVEKNVSFKRNY